MLLIRKKRPTLNTQNDSIPAKLFIEISLNLLFISRLIHSSVFSLSLFSIQRSLTYRKFAFDNSDMSSPKRNVFFSLLFILNMVLYLILMITEVSACGIRGMLGIRGSGLDIGCLHTNFLFSLISLIVQ